MWYLATLDYLPIQASSVPSKHVFSSSAETDTKHHNRLRPLLMEALQMLRARLAPGNCFSQKKLSQFLEAPKTVMVFCLENQFLGTQRPSF